jgi:hypothetical protein
MTAAVELIRKVEEAGGSIRVDDGALVVAPKGAIAHLVDDLRQHKAEVINLLRSSASRPLPQVDIEAWRGPFAEWLTSRCAIHPRCNAGLNSLLAKYSDWEIDHVEVPVAPTREVFIQLLAERGFSMVEAYGTVLVSGLAFCEDIDAVLGIPGKRIGSAGRKVRNVA